MKMNEQTVHLVHMAIISFNEIKSVLFLIKNKNAFHYFTVSQVDGRTLCWLCTQAYKRVLAKTRKNQDFTYGIVKSSSSSSLRDGQGDSLETRINMLTAQSERADNKSGLAAAIMRLASSNTTFNTNSSGNVDFDGVGGSSVDRKLSNGHHHHKHKSKSLSEKTSSLLDRTSGLMDKVGSAAGGAGTTGESSESQDHKDGKHRQPHHHKSKSHHHHHSKHHHHHQNKCVLVLFPMIFFQKNIIHI